MKFDSLLQQVPLMLALTIMWLIALFVIFWAMVGYPISLVILNKIFKRETKKDCAYEPTVTVMVVAHNEEKVIEQKLQNLLEVDYPQEKIEFLVASDFSTDKTNDIVESFIAKHPERKIRIHKTVNHYGKTNAQNEAQELCNTEILVMTDANAIFESCAVKELVSYFTDSSIAYVSGQLRYMNTEGSDTANSEGFYWKLDLMCRNIESKLQTITAGNGAIYAVRNEYYVKVSPIECHDSSFPFIFALEKKKSLYNPNAIAYEKAGEVNEDEFKRKVRMNRDILTGICPKMRVFNVFSYHWFTYFYFGHRTCRYLLWLMHLLVLAINIPLAIWGGIPWLVLLGLQILFYLIALIGWVTKSGNRLTRTVFYYCMTVMAQWKGVINIITGKSKPVWEKAESTR
ncbi:Glycosyltransferase, catalytic subunit of cellulose synthase and poly-beta-1,6-N-acetylglucosamine synthase [Fibrobacter sp. UWB16]|uniref:glycosyltransferase n=1 Tax=Fibrobacter sp. UWB16 TaxID=1945874 RepID=UPI000BDA95C9|nr:glycosyltransferase [Fibrobacter sp. UWB16]SOD11549.1 Glycosyltransferase, catalytic subunit of cellulose synthase and poly-beta-1,6-N-acetylglucosamine synthase [Fibrobacter sp. UWB16]